MGNDLDKLRPFLPEQCLEAVYGWLHQDGVRLRITASRRSKLGDFRNSMPGKPAIISLNADLNKFTFFVVFVHEYAHFKVWKHHGRRAKPHGKEWKAIYTELMTPFLTPAIFPAELLFALKRYFADPRAASGTDLLLTRLLKTYDAPGQFVTVEEIAPDAVFALPDGRQFRKIERLRKRYKCICLSNNRIYLFHPLAEIIPAAI
jgi:SprT protein